MHNSGANRYINIASGGGSVYHNASASLPAQTSLPPKNHARTGSVQQQHRQSVNKDYVQINPPASFVSQSSNHSQNSSPSRSRNFSHSSPTKSIGSTGSRPAMEEINGSDYVCMSGGTLTKKLQQVQIVPGQIQQQQTQVVFQKPPAIPPLANIDLKMNYVTPANELPQAQYSTAANQQIDAIAVAKQSVNFNNLSNSPTAVSPTPSNLSAGSGKSECL